MAKLTKQTRMVGCRLVSLLAVGTLTIGMAFADTITVAQGDTQNITAAATVTAMEVHGTLRLRGTSKTDVAELTFDPSSTPASLGTAAGDNAIIDIGDYGRIKGGLFSFGGLGGVGGFVIGGKRKNDMTGIEWDGATAHLATGQLRISEDAKSDSGVIDILTLNSGAAAGMNQNVGGKGARIVNASTNVDARILFNGGYFACFNAFNATYLFSTMNNSQFPSDIPAGAGGKSIILESVNGNRIDLRFANGGMGYPKYGSVNFRGAGDVVLYSTDRTYVYGWQWDGSATDWQQNGDLILTGTFRFLCFREDCLPCATTNGIVQLQGNDLCYLDLRGKNQKMNGLVANTAMLTNSSATATRIVFGSGKADGVLSVKKVGCTGLITAVKQGTGTLIVTNTPYFPAIKVTGGTVHFKNDDCTLGSLAVNAPAATVVVDGCTLTVNDPDTGLGSAVSCVNGGRLCLSAAANATNAVDASNWSGVALEKAGAGTLILGTEPSAALSSVKVAGGTVAVGVIGSTNHFWRVSFKSTVNGGALAMGPLRLYAHDLSRTDGGGNGGSYGNGTYTDMSSAGITASQLAPKQFICSRSDYAPDKSAEGSNYRPPVAMFGASTVYSCMFKTQPYPSVNNPASWVVMTYRIPNTAAVTYGYDVKSQWEGTGNHPGTWTLESSPDGTDGSWEVMDEKSGMQARTGQCWYHGDGSAYFSTNPYAFPKISTGGGFASSANVQVARGATLDCSHVTGGQTFSSLTVDCAAGTGDGTLVNVAFAAAGEVRLVNFPANTPLENYELPLVFTDAADTLNVHAWTLYVNGVATTKKLSYRNGRLICLPQGTVLLFR